MLVRVVRVAGAVDVVVVDAPAIEGKSKVGVVHHITPCGSSGILAPKLDVVYAPIDTHPVAVLDVGLKYEIVEVIVEIESGTKDLHEVWRVRALVGDDAVGFVEVARIASKGAVAIQ